MKLSRTIGVFAAAVFAIALAGCGDTWSGLKKDTGDNMEAVGESMEKTGKEIKE
jgi:hypothetical protein